ncbi:P-type ATPase, partial [Staphylococcus epidermidis]
LQPPPKSHTTNPLTQFLNLQPKQPPLIKQNKQIILPLHKLKLPHTLLIKPPQNIPLHPKLTKPHTSIHQSILTPHSIPLQKTSPHSVIPSTINKNPSIMIQPTQLPPHTPLSHIIKLLHHPQTSKPPIQPLPHIISPYFLPILLTIPLITFIISIIFLHP